MADRGDDAGRHKRPLIGGHPGKRVKRRRHGKVRRIEEDDVVGAWRGMTSRSASARSPCGSRVYIACHAVESNVITPIMLSRRLTLNAVVVFLAVVGWGWLWGIPGALMAVPLLAVLKVIADRVDGLAGLSEFLGGREPAPD